MTEAELDGNFGGADRCAFAAVSRVWTEVAISRSRPRARGMGVRRNHVVVTMSDGGFEAGRSTLRPSPHEIRLR